MLAWNEGEARINYLQGDDSSYRIVMCGHCMHVHGCVVQLYMRWGIHKVTPI